jgi:hypothetical protein
MPIPAAVVGDPPMAAVLASLDDVPTAAWARRMDIDRLSQHVVIERRRDRE